MSHIEKNAPIGLFDSGIGGISVLRSLKKLMPNENYVFIEDSKNAPYGVKSEEEVCELSEKSLVTLLEKGAKQIVIACNTATAVAADYLREKYCDIDIVGIEPAIKPAVEENIGKRIVLLATDLTLHQKRIYKLYERFESLADIELLPCIGLVELIEAGHLNDSLVTDYFRNLFGEKYNDVGAFILGCTHYPLVSDAIKAVVGEDVRLYDGSLGTAKRSMALLSEKNLLTDNTDEGKVEIINTANDEKLISLSYEFLK